MGSGRAGRGSWLAGVLCASLVPAAQAGIFGVPTNLNANGTTSGSSVNPPGWFILSGPNAATAGGDNVHQVRLFIEVTGTSLDLRVFDAGTSDARDFRGGGDYDTTTEYALLDPTGATIESLQITDDLGLTDNRLARFSDGGAGFTAANGGLIFTGLQPGLYVFRVRTLALGGQDDDDYNAFGVQACNGSCETTPVPYNVYTFGDSDTSTGTAGASETSLIIGGVHGTGGTSTSPFSDITDPMMFFPYVDRGCSLQSSNFDHDGVGDGDSVDLGQTHPQAPTTTGLTISANEDHDENTLTIEATAGANLEVINYGLWSLVNDAGSNFNVIDWRFADFQGWNNNPTPPRDPVSPIRTYLPNAYRSIPGGGCASSERSFGTAWCATLPPVPSLAASTRYVSGANPPVAGATTRFLISASLDNCLVRNATDATVCDVASAAASSVQLSIPILPASGTVSYAYVAGSQAGFIDGTSAACTDGSGGGFRRCSFASLGGSQVATLNIEVDVTLAAGATGRQVLTGSPAAGAPPPNTTVWAQYTPAFSSASFSRTETRGPLCNLSFTVGTTLATRAALAGLRADPGGLVEFATGSQRGSVAFNVYATSSLEGASPVRIAGPVRVRVPDSQTPTLYHVPTRPFSEPYLLIEEIDAAGRRRMLGPFGVGDARLADALGRLQALMAEAGSVDDGSTSRLGAGAGARWAAAAAAARGSLPARAARLAAKAAPAALGARIEVMAPGLVQLPLAELAPLGLPSGFDARRLRLTNLGVPVDFTVIPDGSGAPLAIEFLAKPLSTDYTGRNVYVLTWRGAPPRLRASLTRSEDPRGEAVRAERNQIYLASAPEGSDPWLWDLLFGDGTAWPYVAGEGSFDLPGLVPGATGAVPVRVRFVGRTPHLHRVEAFVNGASIGAMTFRGSTTALLQGTVPAETLQATGNELSIVYQASDASPQEIGLVYLNYLDVGAPVAPPTQAASVALAPYNPRLPGFKGVKYLVVTHGDFVDAASRIASLKASEGLRAAVVDVERAYDRFSAGVVEARAIHSLLRAAAAGGVRYVLLVGDDTFDTHDYLGTGATSFVPSLIGWDGEFGRIPAENLYADLNGDGRPELAIGRLPVSTPEQAEAMADKIAGQAAALAGAVTHLFAVDNQAPGDTPFAAEAEALAAALPPGASVAWARVADGIDVARAALFAGLDAGTAFTHYLGHAGPELWADEALLTVPDVDALQGGGPGTVLFAWSCEAQWYLNLTGPAIDEALVLRPAGGAVAALGPAGITGPEHQRVLAERVYRGFFNQHLPLGEAIRRAKGAALRLDADTLPAVLGFNLLGDPALRVPR
jgi:hypothetical protein